MHIDSAEINLTQLATANGNLSPQQIEALIVSADIVFAVLPPVSGEEARSFIVKGERELRKILRSRKAAKKQVGAFWCKDLNDALYLHKTFGDGKSVH